MVLPPGQVEHVARLHLDLVEQISLCASMVFRRKASIIVPLYVNRVVGAPLVDTPNLAAFDVQGKYVGVVEMRHESLMSAPGAVGIAHCDATRRRLQRSADARDAW